MNYCELEKNLELMSQEDNHILLTDEQEAYSVDKLEALIELSKHAEISLFIHPNTNLSQKLIEFCIKHRIILYFDFQETYDMEYLRQLGSLDLVAMMSAEQAEIIPDEVINDIISCNLNLIIKIKEGDFQRISAIYSRFLNKGFMKLFHLSLESNSDETEMEKIYLINREMITKFNINQNYDIKSQIDSLKRNAMRRYNRTLNTKNTDKINVCFVNLNVNLHMRFERKNLGIEYLASVLNMRGYHADCLYSDKFTVISGIEALIAENDIKVIGFSCMQDNIYVVQNAIKYIKAKYPNIVCTVGGAQAGALDQTFVEESGADYIMVGESENSITELMDYIFHEKGNIEEILNVCYMNSQGVYVRNPLSDLICDLDSIPFPNYVLKSDDNLTYAGIITGRGCPFKCAFCYEGTREKTVRYRSLDNVFEEISVLLKNNKNVKAIQFYDDTFTLNTDRVREFCRRMKKVHDEYGISWICEIHCQTVYDKPELLKMMVDAGLNEAQIGIESGDDTILKKLNKTITSDMIIKTVENCRTAGLYMLEGNIMLGAAGETKEQLEANLEFAERLITAGKGMLQIYPVLLWPFPNTPITLNPSKFGVKVIEEQCDYTVNCISNCVTESETVPRQEFVEYFYKLTDKFSDVYFRLAAKFTAKEARKHWLNGSFSFVEQWGRSLSAIKYMNTFNIAKDKQEVDLSNDEVYPVRTFDVLSYKGNQLYLRETDILVEELDSRILELCNGKNNVKEIAKRLSVDLSLLHERLKVLENIMLVYGSII